MLRANGRMANRLDGERVMHPAAWCMRVVVEGTVCVSVRKSMCGVLELD